MRGSAWWPMTWSISAMSPADSLRDCRRRRAAADAGPDQSADFSDLRAPLPVMPGPGRAWDLPPAGAAALIAAGAARGDTLPADAPPWAVWLARAVGGDRSAH